MSPQGTTMPEGYLCNSDSENTVTYLVLAKPKSHIFRSQEAVTSRLLGFRSRCNTFAVCTYLSPFKIYKTRKAKSSGHQTQAGSCIIPDRCPHTRR